MRYNIDIAVQLVQWCISWIVVGLVVDLLRAMRVRVTTDDGLGDSYGPTGPAYTTVDQPVVVQYEVV